MRQESTSKKDKITVIVVFVLLILYNLAYALSKFFPEYSPGIISEFHDYYQSHKLFITALEFVGVATVVVDTVLRIDLIKQPARFFQLATVMLLVMAFIFKAFVGYLEAVFRFPS